LDKGTNEGGVSVRSVGQELIQPRRDPVHLLVSFRKSSGMNQSLPHIMLVAAGRQLVQEVVTELLAARS
jgi:hypothetical protein